MDWSQYLMAGLLLAALAGRQWFAWVIVAGNFVGTMFLADNPLDVAIIDITAACFLLTGDRKAQAVALIFVAMQPVYIAAWAFDWPGYATYTCIDILAVVQLGVIGGLGGGGHRIRRKLRFSIDPLSSRRNAGVGLARNNEAGEG